MLSISIVAITFGLIFVGELPDKTAIASLVLGTRFPWRWVFLGVATAFAAHVVIAITAGSLLHLLPHRAVEGLVALLFLVGAILIWREGSEDVEAMEADDEVQIANVPPTAGMWRVATLGFGVIFVAEWGDLTQIMMVNLAAKYHDPISVGIGAVLGLWCVALLAILGGKALLRVLPMVWITRVAAVIMAGLGVYSAVNLFTT